MNPTHPFSPSSMHSLDKHPLLQALGRVLRPQRTDPVSALPGPTARSAEERFRSRQVTGVMMVKFPEVGVILRWCPYPDLRIRSDLLPMRKDEKELAPGRATARAESRKRRRGWTLSSGNWRHLV